jgi:hypothetical protein
MIERLTSTLAEIGLSDLLPIFEAQGIDDAVLGELSDADLKEIGIKKLGDRKKLLSSFTRIFHDTSAPPDPYLLESQEIAGAADKTKGKSDANPFLSLANGHDLPKNSKRTIQWSMMILTLVAITGFILSLIFGGFFWKIGSFIFLVIWAKETLKSFASQQRAQEIDSAFTEGIENTSRSLGEISNTLVKF